MKMNKNIGVQDLLATYILRSLKEFPFIKVSKIYDEKNERSIVVISLGFEKYDYENDKSFLQFNVYERFGIEFELAKLEKYIVAANRYVGVYYDGGFVRCTLKENELLLEKKFRVPHKMRPEKLHDKALEKYLEDHKRTVLNLYRFKHLSEDREKLTILGRGDIATAEIVLSSPPSYLIDPEGGELHDRMFQATRFELDNLDRNLFEIYAIKKNWNTIVYEIINKTYEYRHA